PRVLEDRPQKRARRERRRVAIELAEQLGKRSCPSVADQGEAAGSLDEAATGSRGSVRMEERKRSAGPYVNAGVKPGCLERLRLREEPLRDRRRLFERTPVHGGRERRERRVARIEEHQAFFGKERRQHAGERPAPARAGAVVAGERRDMLGA